MITEIIFQSLGLTLSRTSQNNFNLFYFLLSKFFLYFVFYLYFTGFIHTARRRGSTMRAAQPAAARSRCRSESRRRINIYIYMFHRLEYRSERILLARVRIRRLTGRPRSPAFSRLDVNKMRALPVGPPNHVVCVYRTMADRGYARLAAKVWFLFVFHRPSAAAIVTCAERPERGGTRWKRRIFNLADND